MELRSHPVTIRLLSPAGAILRIGERRDGGLITNTEVGPTVTVDDGDFSAGTIGSNSATSSGSQL